MIINRIPEAPVGICVTFDDDTEVPIEVGYQGLNEEGEHLWLQVSPRFCREASSRATTWTSCQRTP